MDEAGSKSWLEGESELQIQLTSSPRPKDHALEFFDPRPCYHVLVETISTTLLPSVPSTSQQQQPGSGGGLIPNKVTSKVLDRESGTCEVKDQGQKGIPLLFGSGGENREQIVLFTARAPLESFSNIGFLFSVSCEGGSTPVGRASLLPEHFLSEQHCRGTLCLTVFSQADARPLGVLRLSYLLIHPTKDILNNLSMKHEESWKGTPKTLNIGHRGLGDSYCEDEKRNPPVTENTITSLRRAREFGADYVEFDVQLTRDLVPVIYHDFKTCMEVKGGCGVGVAEQQQLSCIEVFVKDLSMEQIRCLKLKHVKAAVSAAQEGLVEPHALDLEANDTRPFPTLKELFLKIPESVGFNVEVKYPVPEIIDDKRDFPYFNHNTMADQILQVVSEHAGERKIIFSCFDADMCTMLRLKQARYPVLFLTVNDCPQWNVPVDMRSRRIEDALMHAQAQGLQGINIDSHQLLKERDANWVDTVKNKRGFTLYTWGRENNLLQNVRLQRAMGVDAVIFDRIDEIMANEGEVEL